MKQLLLSFLSPCGRIGRGGYWERQLLIYLLLTIFASIAASVGTQAYGRNADWETPFFFLSVLGQGCPLSLAAPIIAYEGALMSFLAKGGDSSVAALSYACGMLSYALCLLLGWCSFALLLRRLRDTRPGLWGLPFSLPVLWMLPIAYFMTVPMGAEGEAGAEAMRWQLLLFRLLCLPLVLNVIFTCLPSRKARAGCTTTP